MKLIIEIPDKVYNEYREGVMSMENDCIISNAVFDGIPYEERPQGEWIEFANWVAKEVLDDYFEESSGAFAEIACRKLVKLGLVEVKDNVYKLKGGAK